MLNGTAIPLLFHMVPTTTDAYITSWHKLFVCCPILCYQPSSYNCIYLTIILKLVTPKVLLHYWKYVIINQERIRVVCRMLLGSLITKTVCHVNSFSDQRYSFYMNCYDIQECYHCRHHHYHHHCHHSLVFPPI